MHRLPVVIATVMLGADVLAGCGGSGDPASTATTGATTAAAARKAAAPESACSSDTHRNGTNLTAWVVRVVNSLPYPITLRATDWTCGRWWFHDRIPGQFDGAVVPAAGGAVEKTMLKASVTPGFALVVSNQAGAEIGRFAINQVERNGSRPGLVSVGGSPFGPVATMPGGAPSDGVPVTVSAEGGSAKTTVTLCPADQGSTAACS